MVKKGIVVILSLVLLLMCLAPPAFAAIEYKMMCPNCGTVQLQGELTQHAYCAKCGCSLAAISMGGGGSRGGGAGRLETAKKYYTAPGAGGGNSYTGGGTSYYSVMNTTNNTLNYTTYNSTTNNYTTNNYTYNNYTYNNEYNYYTYNVTNQNYYVTNNYTYVTISYPGDEEGKYENVDIYYELPDGRNSSGLKAEDVWGQYFIYNAVNYQEVLEDDGVTLGLFHFDNNLANSAASTVASVTPSQISYAAGLFEDALVMRCGTAVGRSLGYGVGSSPLGTVEFWYYVSGTVHQYSNSSSSEYWSNCSPSFSSGSILMPTDTWCHIALVKNDSGTWNIFLNGTPSGIVDRLLVVSNDVWFEKAQNTRRWSSMIGIDELRLSSDRLYTSKFTPSRQPFDTNSVLVQPSDAAPNDVAVRSNIRVSGFRVGGVRPTFPVNGYVYVYLENGVVKDIQQYQVDGWYTVDATIYTGEVWENFKGRSLAEYGNSDDFPTPTPGPGAPTPTPGPGDSDNPGGGMWDKITGFFDRVWGFFVGIPTFFEGLISKLLDVADVLDDFGPAVAAIYTWLPPDWQAVLGVGFSAVMGFSLLGLFRRK